MDLFLLAECRFFIGTTSGLTSAVQALGTPMLLLNCTSADCQFWTENTDFILKPVYDRSAKRYLSLRETYRQPVQSFLIDGAVLAKHGYEIHSNTADEITAAIDYKLDCLFGVQHRLSEAEPVMQAYRRCLADNCFNFGAAIPAKPFLTSRPELING
jgi:putative glycosyltransferase (TIGR04372 family)